MTELNLIPPPIQKHFQNQAPLSPSQEGLWFLHQFSPNSAAYNLIYLFKLKGGVNYQILEQSLNALVLRHEIFRTIYPTDKDGKPFQVVQPFEPLKLLWVDYSTLEENEKEQTLREYAIESGSVPFDLQNGPISRFALLHSEPEEDYLFFAIHHIAFDDWSRYVFIQDLLQLYEAYQSRQDSDLPVLPIQYTDYALWQREWVSGETQTALIQHWKNILFGELPILALSTDHARQVKQTYHGSRTLFELSPSLTARIKEFCREERLTPSHLFMAAYAIFLMRYTGQEDIIIGCPFANRPRSEQTNLIGYFINTLPIRLNLGNNPSVRELLSQTRTVMLDASAWKALPFDTLVAELAIQRELGRTPIYQAMINILNVPKRQRSIAGLEIDLYFREQMLADFDISFEFSNAGEYFNASVFYNADLFDESTILRMASHYRNILEEMLNKPDSPLSELEMLSPTERKQILMDWNDTRAEYPFQSCLHELFEAQVRHTPEAIAVVFENEQITYRELNARSNQLANHLRKLGVDPEIMVGAFIDRSVQAITGILGILKAGGVYMPLATDLPPDRLGYILEDARPLVVLTLDKLLEKLPGNAFQLVCLDTDGDQIAQESEGNLICSTGPENLACIIYTSGSTGEPKGVMLPHRAFCNNLHYLQATYQLQVTDQVLQHMPLSFDFSVWEIFCALVSGACLVVADQNKKSDMDYLVQLIEEQGITIAGFVPSHLDAFLEARKINNQLRLVFSGGEVLNWELQKRFFAKYSAKLINTYGPTEATIDVCHWICKNNDIEEAVPIGKPIGNTQLYILDQRLLPVPIGAPGELYIGGDCLTRGYLNQPELTAEKFIANPFSNEPTRKLYRTGDLVRYLPGGEIVFMGRLDNQVKLRGFRIELGEIENAIRQYQGIQQVFVMVQDSRTGDKRLVAYIILAPETILEVDKLRGFLREKIPAYMIPSAIISVDSFPLTVNGKIDRNALPAPDLGALVDRELVAPRNKTEQILCQVWMDVLGRDRLSVEDNFFDIGGNSLLAIQVMTRIRKEFEIVVPVTKIFEYPGLQDLASQIDFIVLYQKPASGVPEDTKGRTEYTL